MILVDTSSYPFTLGETRSWGVGESSTIDALFFGHFRLQQAVQQVQAQLQKRLSCWARHNHRMTGHHNTITGT